MNTHIQTQTYTYMHTNRREHIECLSRILLCAHTSNALFNIQSITAPQWWKRHLLGPPVIKITRAKHDVRPLFGTLYLHVTGWSSFENYKEDKSWLSEGESANKKQTIATLRRQTLEDEPNKNLFQASYSTRNMMQMSVTIHSVHVRIHIIILTREKWWDYSEQHINLFKFCPSQDIYILVKPGCTHTHRDVTDYEAPMNI